ncbi:MAG: mechanosensitive ion channel [Novosphingobium sp.]|nr:mechanosensitive ion channel [Novosphingobium sp.]
MSSRGPEAEAAVDAPADAAANGTEAVAIDPLTGEPLPPPDLRESVEAPVEVAEGIKNVVASESQTIGNFIETLDSYAIDIGDVHISVWSALVVLLIIVAIIAMARLCSKLAHWLLGRASALDPTQKLLTEKLVSVVVWVLAILIGLETLGIDLTALAVFSGAFGLAIGFGLQKTFGNLIAGIILLMDRSIKPGDTIGVNDGISNTVGQIRKIGLRAVSVITRDKKEYLIPNENLMINQVENWSYSSREVRVRIPVGVAYGSDMVLAEKLMRQATEDTPRILRHPQTTVLMMAYGDSSVNFEIRIWITDPEDGISNVRSEVLKRLWVLFKDNGVEIPFPQRDINLRDNDAFRDLLEAMRDRLENAGDARGGTG